MLLLLMGFLAVAGNSAYEGIFINGAHSAVTCLKNTDMGCLTQTATPSGRTCQADGVMLENGTVYKIPDHSVYVCGDEDCVPFDVASLLIFEYAQYSKGDYHYGPMTLEDFEQFFPKGYCP
jgi:hypothetical protein